MAFVNNYRDFLFENYRHKHYSDREDLRLSKARILNSAGLPEEYHSIFLNRIEYLMRFIGDCIENMDFPPNVNRTRVIVFGDIMAQDPNGQKYYPTLEVMNKPPDEKGGGKFIYSGSVYYAVVNKDVMTTILVADRNVSLKQIEGKAKDHMKGSGMESWPIKMIQLNPTNKLIIDLSLSTSEFEDSLQCQIIANPTEEDTGIKTGGHIPKDPIQATLWNPNKAGETELVHTNFKGEIMKNTIRKAELITLPTGEEGVIVDFTDRDKPRSFKVGGNYVIEIDNVLYKGVIDRISYSKRDGILVFVIPKEPI